MPLTALIALLTLTPPADSVTAVVDVNVVDVEGGQVAEHRTVLIENGVITRVEAAGTLEIPRGATVVPGRGRYLMPGLIDTHLHVHDPDDLPLLLAHGVTSARILDGTRSDLRMKASAPGRALSPRLRVCLQVDRVKDGATAERVVAKAKADGFDCLKLYSPPDWDIDAYRALAQAAAAAGLPLDGHLPRNQSLSDLLAGPHQSSVAHLEEFLYTYFFRPENRTDGRVDSAQAVTVARMIARSGVVVGTTLNNYRTVGAVASGGFDSLRALPELRYVPPRARARWSDDDNVFRKRLTPDNGARLLTNVLPVLGTLAREIAAAGGTLVVGTDASWNLPFMIPGVSMQWELNALVRAGLTPPQVLKAATLSAALLLGEHRLGRIAPGYLADALLLDRNPLEDVGNVSALAGVIRQGEWVPRGVLQDALAALARERR